MNPRSRNSIHENANGIVIILLVTLAIGYVIGGSIQGEKNARGAIQWALKTTAQCERTLESEGHSTVTECLELAIWAAEDELRATKHDEGQAAR